MHLTLSAHDFGKVRFGMSALWQITLSLRVLQRSPVERPHRAWAERVRADADPRAVRLLSALAPDRAYFADVMTPSTAHADTSFGEELAAFRALPDEVLLRDLAALYRRGNASQRALLEPLLASPDRARGAIAEALEAYWLGAIAADWPRMCAILVADIDHRMRTLSREGLAGALRGLHPSVALEGDRLIVLGACEADADRVPDAGVVFIPSVFGGSELHVLSRAPFVPAVAYGARGSGALWSEPSGRDDGLPAVLGGTRSRVLRAMRAPLSTAEAAALLGLSRSSANDQLRALEAGGLARRVRDGRTVRFVRTEVGERLARSPEFEASAG